MTDPKSNTAAVARTGEESNPFAEIFHALTPARDVSDAFAVGTLTALSPLTVVMGEQTYYDDEIILTRHLTERTEEVTPAGWQTSPQTCTASHAHEIPQKRVQLTVHSPLKVGQRLLLLPRRDQQMIYVVDILP